jgi:hypothetical protein
MQVRRLGSRNEEVGGRSAHRHAGTLGCAGVNENAAWAPDIELALRFELVQQADGVAVAAVDAPAQIRHVKAEIRGKAV